VTSSAILASLPYRFDMGGKWYVKAASGAQV
jgi:hypothetical protein